MDQWWLDLKTGLRQLWRTPGLTVAAVLTLAIGIGGTTTVISFVAGVLSLGQPAPDMDRLVALWSHNRAEAETKNVVSMGDFLDWRARATSFADMQAWRPRSFNVSGAGAPVRVNATEATPGYIEFYRWRPAAGRSFETADVRSGAPRVVVLSHPFWRDHFAGRPDAIGHPLRLDGEVATVVGVLPQDAVVTGVLTPLAIDEREPRSARTLFVWARLAPGVSIAQARSEMESIGRALEGEQPATNRGWTVNTQPLQEEFVGPQARLVFAVLAVTALAVMLIGCTNVANLLLARGATRQGEMAVRLALGAGGRRIVRQLLVECGLLALGGALGSLLVSKWGLSFLLSTFPGEGPWLSEGLNVRVLLVTAAASLLAVVVAGLVPSLAAGRTSLLDGLYAAGRGSAALSRRRLTRVLVGLEVSLAVLLLVIAGLGTRTLIALERLEPGFDITHLLTARVTLPERLPPETAAEWFRGAAQEIGRLPGVEAVGATSRLPFAGGRFNPNLGLEIEGYVPTDERGTWAVDYTVTPGYLETIKVPMVEGRSMADSDGPDAPRVAVINEAMARRYWPGRSPLGARLRIGTDAASATWRTIVGVVGNIRNDDADQPPVPYLYIPLAQGPLSSMSLALRTSGDPTALAEPLRRTLAAYDADQPVYEVRSMEQLLDEDLRGSRVLIQILELFAAVALGLAGIGIWGVVAHSVGQRTREIGLRMALGATRAQVLRTVVGQGLMPVVLGLTAGIVAALMAGRLMQRILFQVSPQDPMTLGLTALALTTVSLIAMLGPGLRAARMDPLRALREE